MANNTILYLLDFQGEKKTPTPTKKTTNNDTNYHLANHVVSMQRESFQLILINLHDI